MALVQVDFISEKLKRTVTINAIIPVDKNTGQTKEKLKTLYLLHGIFGNYTDWVCGTRIQRWAQDHDLAVIMPSGENKFYVDNELSHEYFSQFIGEELVQITRAMFPLSHLREDTFIAGLSMGGYGALMNGLKYHQTFGYIGALSAALLLDDFIQAKDGEDVPYMMKRSYLTSVFGDLTKLKGSDKDYKALIEKMDIQDVPAIYMACGTEDSLLPQNRDYRDFLKAHHIPVTYEEGPGGHEWDFWDCYIKHVLEWLPINEKNEELSSGHIEMD